MMQQQSSGGVRGSGRRAVTGRVDAMTALALPGVAFALFVAAPLLALTIRAIQAGNLLDGIRRPLVYDALRLSLITSAITLVIVVALGTPLAYGLARWRFAGKALLDTLIDLPVVLPPVVAGVALLMAFGRRGLFGGLLQWGGVELAFTSAAVLLAQVFVSAPFYIRAAKAGFLAVHPDLEGMAYTLGASRLRTFWRVTLPQARPAVLGGAVLCWARALSEFGATMMFAGNFPGETQTLPLAIVTAMESDLFAALAISLVLLAISAAALVLFRVIGGRAGL